MLASGTQLGRYEIAAQLGVGGMGEVYRATDSRLDRQVAIKVLPPQFVQDQARLARFEREAKVVAALSHPNILGIHDFATEAGQTFAVMELLEGETLRGRVAHGAIPWRRAVEIAVAIADGLAATHAKGIIHRDLKPENIFLTADGRVKILDFGLARIKPTSTSGDGPTGTYHPDQTEAGTILGTVGYMSPEQVRGQEANGASDVFSLGCMLHEMVTGKRAFSRETAVETMTAILHDDPPELADSGKKAPLELERLIRHCLEKNPAARFHSAHDLAYALRAIQPDSKAQERGLSKGVVWGAAALALAVIAGLVVGFNNRRPIPVRDRPFESVAVLPFENVTGDPKAEPISDGIADHLSINLSQLRDRDFKVTPFTSASRFRGPKIDLKAAGSALGVQAVVTGKLYQEGETLSINVALSDARADNLIWGQQYRGKRSEILALQDEIAKGLVAHLGLRLSDADEQRLLKHHTEDPTAYLLYQEGMYHWHKLREESLRTAIDCFQRALKIDPQFARAHEGLGRCYGVQDAFSVPPKECHPKAKVALQKALELDGSLAEAHAGMGHYYMFYEHNWPAAESSLKEALRLNPRLSDAHHLYGFYLAARGQTAPAVAELKTARELNSQAPVHSAGLAQVLFCAHQYDQQLAESQKMLELAPNFPLAHLSSGTAYALLGKYDEASQAFQKQLAIDKRHTASFGLLGYTYARWGKRADAEKVLQEITDLSERQYFSGFERARIYAGLGENDKAIDWLEKAYEEHDWGMVWLKVDPTLDTLRSNRRFGDLLRRMGLADQTAAREQGIDSVAVLPLVVRGDYPRGEALSEGVPRTLIRNLLEVPSLKVAPFSSVAHYAQKSGVDLRDVGRQLEVAAVLAGRISPGEQAHVLTVELMDVHQNRSLWLQEYDLRQDLLFIQDDILKELAARLGWQLSAEQKARLARRPTQDTAAYLEYLEGQYAARQWTVSGIKQGIDRLERAVARDPSFALAHAALAEAYIVAAHIIMQPKAALEKARQAAEEAIRRDRALAEGHNALAVVKMCADWDWAGAEKAFQEALRLNPNCAIVHDWYGWYWNSLGQMEKAVAQMEKALELEPRSSLYNVDLAYIYLNARRYDDAARQARKALALDPQDGQAPEVLAAVYVLRDRDYPAAVRELEALVKRDERPNRYTQLGWVYGRWLKRPEALRMLQRLDGLGNDWHIQGFERAEIYASLEDKDQAFQYLDQTLEERSPAILYLKLSPVWDPLRDDPRFDALLRRIGVADEPEGKDQPLDTLAVLPFDNQSPDPEAGYLGDDITYSLTDSLMRVRELIVRPYGSAARYKPGSFDAKTAGRELQAQAVLRGSIQKRGDEILIEVELMHVGEDRRIWGDRYPGKLADRLALQQRIIQEVPDRLRLALTGQEKQALAKLPTPSLKAHELYVQGRIEWNNRTPEGLGKSITLFRRAIDEDQNYALAWAGLADAYRAFPLNTDSRPRDFMPQAKAAANKAVEIDDQLAEAHTALASIAMVYDWDWSKAERGFQRALALNPNYATARFQYSQCLTLLGRFDEAQVHSKRAVELDPLSPITRASTGRRFYYAGQYDTAIEQYQKAFDIDPNFWQAHLFLGQAYAQQGLYPEAISQLQKAHTLSSGRLESLASLGHVYAVIGKTAEAQTVLDELTAVSQQRYVPPYYFAIIHVALGEKDQAFTWLDKAYEDRNRLLAFLNVEPMVDSLKGEPRFQKIVTDMKFPP